MKCSKCGSTMEKGQSVCEVCGSYGQGQTEQVVTAGKTKSRSIATFLAVLGVSDFYLYSFGDAISRMFLGGSDRPGVFSLIFTLGISGVVYNLKTARQISNGTINCDYKGTPLV